MRLRYVEYDLLPSAFAKAFIFGILLDADLSNEEYAQVRHLGLSIQLIFEHVDL